jgi:hypothetical protein
VATRSETGLDHGAAKLHERPDDVDDRLPAFEKFCERVGFVFNRDALVVMSGKLRHPGHFLLQPLFVASRSDERNPAFGKLPRRELACVTTRSIEHHFVCRCHSSSP